IRLWSWPGVGFVMPCDVKTEHCPRCAHTIARPRLAYLGWHGVADLFPHGDSRQQERRQYPRTRVSWRIVVYAGSSRFLSRSLDISPFGAKVRTNQRTQDGHVGAAQNHPAGGLSPSRRRHGVARGCRRSCLSLQQWHPASPHPCDSSTCYALVRTRHGHAPTFTATFLGPGLALAGARVPLTPSSAWDGCLHQVAPLRLELVLVDLAPRVALPEDVERDIMRTLVPALAHEPTDGQHDAHDHGGPEHEHHEHHAEAPGSPHPPHHRVVHAPGPLILTLLSRGRARPERDDYSYAKA